MFSFTKISVLLFSLALLSVGSVAFSDEPAPQAPSVEDRLLNLEKSTVQLNETLNTLASRIESIENRGGGHANAWSCVARCGGFNRYNNELFWKMVGSEGQTAFSAYNKMDEACDDYLFTGVETLRNGSQRIIPATIESACVRNL